ncbi:hypothetical protein JYU34_012158 [Plutella xylostella]|uniref:Protein RED C-terminal domain-containing protein n=1 Tax=Plutella xylostella TaxID=51655 RepID=A0ABQ7QEH7_PLUXY|nr:hypothetical protein JYU34_012158 [Plutella xylostella]
MDDAIDDSDDDPDYTKMDAGNKKGPIGECSAAAAWAAGVGGCSEGREGGNESSD